MKANSANTDMRESGGFDGFNEDLAWILNKLVVRTGGAAGTISGQIAGEAQPTLLATTFCDIPEDLRLSTELNLRSSAVLAPATSRNHDAPELVHSLLNLQQKDGSKSRYRLLQLAFSPADGVKVIATVAQESRLGFKFLEDTVARRLYPVLSRYVRLWWAHRAERRSALALKTVIDLSDLAIMLLNRSSRLLFANARASALLAARDGLMQEGQGIVPVGESARAPFHAAVAESLHTNQTLSVSDTGAAASPILQIDRNNHKRELMVAILPLRVPALDSEDPAVIVYGLDPDQDLEDLLAPVCEIYKLTSAEARLVGRLISGNTIAEAAERINIRPQTARAYLKSIFIKTRTHRQAELVRVLLSSTLRTAARG